MSNELASAPAARGQADLIHDFSVSICLWFCGIHPARMRRGDSVRHISAGREALLGRVY